MSTSCRSIEDQGEGRADDDIKLPRSSCVRITSNYSANPTAVHLLLSREVRKILLPRTHSSASPPRPPTDLVAGSICLSTQTSARGGFSVPWVISHPARLSRGGLNVAGCAVPGITLPFPHKDTHTRALFVGTMNIILLSSG